MLAWPSIAYPSRSFWPFVTSPQFDDQSVRHIAPRFALRRFLICPALLLTLATGACVPSIPLPPVVQPVATGDRKWLVEPGDVIRLRTWLTTDQSGDLPVNERGEVLIPTVGRLNVLGLTPAAVEAAVVRAYNNRIDSTRVDVTFLRPVSVLGGVKTPGVQLADPSVSVLSLISRAGGPTRAGGDMHVYLLRVGEPTHEISIADRVSDLGIRSTDQLYAKDPTFVVRNEAAVRSAYEVLQILATTLTLVVLIRRP